MSPLGFRTMPFNVRCNSNGNKIQRVITALKNNNIIRDGKLYGLRPRYRLSVIFRRLLEDYSFGRVLS